MSYPVKPVDSNWLAQATGCSYQASTQPFFIRSVSCVSSPAPDSLCYLTAMKQYSDALVNCCVITTPNIATKCQLPHFIESDNPRLAFANALQQLQFIEQEQTGLVDRTAEIAPGAMIDASARISEGVQIASGVYVGRNVSIGPHSKLAAGVRIGPGCQIGAHAYIDMGAAIGSEGFGFVNDGQNWQTIKHLGSCVLGDHVYIGANTTIDRGLLRDTLIGSGVKIDNQCQIAHNVSVEDHTVIAGRTAVGGSSLIGRGCLIGGGVLISDHVQITDGVILTGGSMVAQDITEKGTYSSGMPAIPNRVWLRNQRQIGQINEVLKNIEKRLP